MCRSSNPISDTSAAGDGWPGIRLLQIHFLPRPLSGIAYPAPCVFFATGTQVRLLLQNYVIHNRYTLFCVWARLSALPCDCVFVRLSGHARKSHYEGFCALVTSARPSLERTENWPLA